MLSPAMSYIPLLEATRAKVDAEVEENFGVAPADELFNNLCAELSYAERLVKEENPEYYEKYRNKYY